MYKLAYRLKPRPVWKYKLLAREPFPFKHNFSPISLLQEMRNVGQHNKYKTKRCQKYWIKGYCAYGPRCNFLHYEERDQVLPKYSQNIQINQKKITTVVRKGSAGEFSGCSSSTTPSSSPPKMKLKLPTTPLPLEILHRPSFGSGRLAAYTKDGELYWLDTRTQKFVWT